MALPDLYHYMKKDDVTSIFTFLNSKALMLPHLHPWVACRVSAWTTHLTPQCAVSMRWARRVAAFPRRRRDIYTAQRLELLVQARLWFKDDHIMVTNALSPRRLHTAHTVRAQGAHRRSMREEARHKQRARLLRELGLLGGRVDPLLEASDPRHRGVSPLQLGEDGEGARRVSEIFEAQTQLEHCGQMVPIELERPPLKRDAFAQVASGR